MQIMDLERDIHVNRHLCEYGDLMCIKLEGSEGGFVICTGLNSPEACLVGELV